MISSLEGKPTDTNPRNYPGKVPYLSTTHTVLSVLIVQLVMDSLQAN